MDPKTPKRILGVILLAFGFLLLVSLVSFIGSEKNGLGPIFGTAVPQAFIYVFGKFSATMVSVCSICWGIWILLSRECPKYLKVCFGISILCVLCPAIFSLLAAHSGNLSLNDEALYASGGRFGFFLVHTLLWPVFGKENFVLPFLFLLLVLLVVFVAFFHFPLAKLGFLKMPFVGFAGFVRWMFARSEKEIASPKSDLKKTKGTAEKSLEKAKVKAAKADEWNSDYTMLGIEAKPFRGVAGAFDGTLPVEQPAPFREETETPSLVSPEATASETLSNEEASSNVAEREIEEKERYLRENEKRMGALEVRALRDEIAHLRQVQQMNNWENDRHSRPTIKGVVVRGNDFAKKDLPEEIIPENLQEVKAPAEESAADLPSESPQTAENTTTELRYDEYVIPQVAEILDTPPEQKPDYTAEELDEISHQLEEQLENFKVKGKVLGISTGPMITRFEVEPGPGVKVSRFTTLHEDLALALKAKSIRILAPIPGKSLVGVEVPNRKLQTVYCREIFESPLFKPQPDKLIIALGKDITGNSYTMDLCRAPHILIAGQTGSGKSVCINTLMASLLFSKSPDELRMILVDPKVVELKLYENIPHLLAPVVTQPDVAVSALRWGCVEMDRRYEVLAQYKVRNLVGYNQKRREQQELIRQIEEKKAAYESAKALAEKIEEENRQEVERATASGESPVNLQEVPAVPDPKDIPPMPEDVMENMPYIVVVIDELADLMMVAGKEVEKYIARIAQKARAVGIHLVIATQRPSVNVITGLIKANLPARISFKVASLVDSRTVMDRGGAEKLLGRGDMLYRSGDDPEPIRVHGGFLTDEEVEKLADFSADQNVHFERLESFDVDDPAEDAENADGAANLSGKIDGLAMDVARYGMERGSLSASEVQRHFSVGFSRAGKILDQLERLRVCGPKRGSKPREMLVNDEQSLYDLWPR